MVAKSNQQAIGQSGSRTTAFRHSNTNVGHGSKNFTQAVMHGNQPEMLSDLEEDKMDLDDMEED